MLAAMSTTRRITRVSIVIITVHVLHVQASALDSLVQLELQCIIKCNDQSLKIIVNNQLLLAVCPKQR